ncbi:lipid-A-disaccharide synthase, partial [Candidatus Marinamargulisbacteria bacterium SCGC AG-439-L15]
MDNLSAPIKIMISAGDVSGDRHGALLIDTLKKKLPNCEFFGLGGHYLKQSGMHIIADLTPYSTIGILEPIRYLSHYIKALKAVKIALKTKKPDLIIPIDSQGFNMQLLKIAHDLNIPSIYYIAPQEWQWGSKKGGKKVVSLSSKILSIHKEEHAFYQELGKNSSYIGHPIVDLVKATLSKKEFYQHYSLSSTDRILSLFPGSREQEIKHIAPILIKTAQNLQSNTKNLRIFISVTKEHYLPRLKQLTKKLGLHNPIFYHDNSYNLIQHATLSLTSSGTITLEHALLKTPC